MNISNSYFTLTFLSYNSFLKFSFHKWDSGVLFLLLITHEELWSKNGKLKLSINTPIPIPNKLNFFISFVSTSNEWKLNETSEYILNESNVSISSLSYI